MRDKKQGENMACDKNKSKNMKKDMKKIMTPKKGKNKKR